MQREVLHDGEDLVAYANIAQADQVVLSFCPWSVQPLGQRAVLEATGFGEGAFIKRGIGELHVVARANHWYQSAELVDVLERIAVHCHGRNVLCYGSSMGAHGALLASGRLNAPFIALAPQFSIDRRIVPEERRWAEEARRIDFIPELVPDGAGPGGYVFYDPFTPADRIQGERAAALYPGSRVLCPFSGHSLTEHVQAVYGLVDLVQAVIESRFDTEEFHRKRRRGRADNLIYLGNMLACCVRRKKWSTVHHYEPRLLSNPGLQTREIVKLLVAYYQIGERERACTLAEQALKRNPQGLSELLMLGKAIHKLGSESLLSTLQQRVEYDHPHSRIFDSLFSAPQGSNKAA